MSNKPFDLQAVASGAEFETTEGRECKFGGFSPDEKTFVVWLNMEGSWDAEEFFSSSDWLSDFFRMKPRKMKRDVWINVYPDNIMGGVFDSKEAANLNRQRGGVSVSATIEWEE